MNQRGLAVGIIILLFIPNIIMIITYIPRCNADTIARSDELYFEDVNVLVFGSCRFRFWMGTWRCVHIGLLNVVGFQAFDTNFEGLRITIFNETILNPWMSFPRDKNIFINMLNATGIFLCSHLGLIQAGPPFLVFVYCHSEAVRVNPHKNLS